MPVSLSTKDIVVQGKTEEVCKGAEEIVIGDLFVISSMVSRAVSLARASFASAEGKLSF